MIVAACCAVALQLSCASKPDGRSAATDGSSTDGPPSSTGPASGAPDVGEGRDSTTGPGPDSSSGADEAPPVVVHGHRGDRGSVPPGNTLPSFRSALGYGVDVLEGDLQITGDGSVVFGHDNDLRTTPCTWAGRGPSSSALVANMTDAQLAQWDCHPELDGVQPPPHLHEVIGLSETVGFNLELKRWGTEAADVYLPALIGEDERCGGCLAPRLIVQSFDWLGLKHVHDNYAATFPVRLSLLAQAPRADELKAAAGWAQIWSPSQDIASASAIAEAQAMGFAVAPWTVNDEAEMQRLIDAGVDAIITDSPDVLLRVLGR